MKTNFHDSLSFIGNQSFIEHFLGEYESEINKRKETEKKDITNAPNYYAWLNIASEYIFYRLRILIYINTEDAKSFDLSYNKTINHLFSQYKNTLQETQKDTIILFAKIRHLIVHKGFPNPHKVPAQNNWKIAKGYPFPEEEVKRIADQIANPQSFPDIKDKYLLTINTIEAIQSNFEHDFGIFKISGKKKS